MNLEDSYKINKRIEDLEGLLSLRDYVTLYPELELKACAELRFLKTILWEILNEDQTT